MALWQYMFHVFPNTAKNILFLQHFEKDEDGYYDDSIFWVEYRITQDFFTGVEKILPLTASWSKNKTQFGDLKSNCFEILWEGGITVSVSFRINYTINYEDILRKFLEFFILRGLGILDENFSVVPLNFEAIKNIIESSEQVKKYNNLSNLN
jgi:hypothetical protein